MMNKLIGVAGMLAMATLFVVNIATVKDLLVVFLCIMSFVCFAISFAGDGWD